jgi:DNA-binding MarR family transcriptional regulator
MPLDSQAELDWQTFSGGEPADQLLWLIHWMHAASRQLRRKLAGVAASCDLSESELLVVWLCHGTGRVQVELASAIGVSPAQMSGLVERLGQRGLVAKTRPARDRRRQMWKTAAEGEALLSQVATPLADLADSLSAGVSPADRELARSLCQRVASAAAMQEQHDEQRSDLCGGPRSGKEAA